MGIYATQRRGAEYLMNEKYVEFIIHKIKPFIDQRYRTLSGRDSTFMLGSSWGANLALFAAWRYSAFFSRIALLSGDFSWKNSALVELLKKARPDYLPVRVWLDMGDQEEEVMGKHFTALEAVYRELMTSGVRSNNVHKETIMGGRHNEDSWAERVGRVLEFILK